MKGISDQQNGVNSYDTNVLRFPIRTKAVKLTYGFNPQPHIGGEYICI